MRMTLPAASAGAGRPGGPTPIQREILEAIRGLTRDRRHPPSMREVLENVDLDSPGALAYGYDSPYQPVEAQAQAAKRGIWAGTFVPPWEWRHRHVD